MLFGNSGPPLHLDTAASHGGAWVDIAGVTASDGVAWAHSPATAASDGVPGPTLQRRGAWAWVGGHWRRRLRDDVFARHAGPVCGLPSSGGLSRIWRRKVSGIALEGTLAAPSCGRGTGTAIESGIMGRDWD